MSMNVGLTQSLLEIRLLFALFSTRFRSVIPSTKVSEQNIKFFSYDWLLPSEIQHGWYQETYCRDATKPMYSQCEHAQHLIYGNFWWSSLAKLCPGILVWTGYKWVGIGYVPCQLTWLQTEDMLFIQLPWGFCGLTIMNCSRAWACP